MVFLQKFCCLHRFFLGSSSPEDLFFQKIIFSFQKGFVFKGFFLFKKSFFCFFRLFSFEGFFFSRKFFYLEKGFVSFGRFLFSSHICCFFKFLFFSVFSVVVCLSFSSESSVFLLCSFFTIFSFDGFFVGCFFFRERFFS